MKLTVTTPAEQKPFEQLLQELAEATAAATPGPWISEQEMTYENKKFDPVASAQVWQDADPPISVAAGRYPHPLIDFGDGEGPRCEGQIGLRPADAKFFAVCRNNLPVVLAKVTTLLRSQQPGEPERAWPVNVIPPEKNVFPNLARRVPGGDVRDEIDEWRQAETDKLRILHEVDKACQAELDQAGIPSQGFDCFRFASNSRYYEVPTMYRGFLAHWSFQRAWYYWVAEGPGIPPTIAEEFHKSWGTHCRVEGDCGCPTPLEENEGFAIGEYHIDTQEGLNAFAELLRSIHRPRQEKA